MKIVLTLAFAAFMAVGAASGVKSQPMTAYETKMVEIELERSELQRHMAAYQMCAVRKQLSPLLTYLESCLSEYAVSLPKLAQKPASLSPVKTGGLNANQIF